MRDLEHPEITMALRTGYPSWMQEDDDDLLDEDDECEVLSDDYEDRVYEDRRMRELFGD